MNPDTCVWKWDADDLAYVSGCPSHYVHPNDESIPETCIVCGRPVKVEEDGP